MIYVPISVGVQSILNPAEVRSVDGLNRSLLGVMIDTRKSDNLSCGVLMTNHVCLFNNT